MAVASFEDFCVELCGLMGAPVPELEPSPSGIIGFTVNYRDTVIGFMKPAETMEPGVLMLVQLGAAPRERQLEVLRILMEANFLMWGVCAPHYALNPATGAISLHYAFTVSQASAQSIFQSVLRSADIVQNWRETYFLDLLEPDTARAADAETRA
jgi:hypothetical protein